VSRWITSSRLQLNSVETEVIRCTYAWRQQQIPTDAVRIGNASLLPVAAVCDLGVNYVNVDTDVSMAEHVTAINIYRWQHSVKYKTRGFHCHMTLLLFVASNTLKQISNSIHTI